MSFEDLKKTALNEHDRSKAGKIDEEIKQVCDVINNHKDFFTTSSCAGRILVYEKEPDAKKNEVTWLLSSHKQITPDQINISNITQDVWFAMQPFIIHIRTRTLDQAQQLITIARQAGLKRGGIVSLKDFPLVELNGVDELSTIIAKKGLCVVEEDYIRLLIAEANKKLEKNAQRVSRFKTAFLEQFSQ